MLIVAGKITLDPAKVDTAKEAMKKVIAATEKEAGNMGYTFSQDIENPAVFHIFEKWESEEALASHLEEPHMAEFTGAMGDFGVTDATVRKYDVSAERDFF